jgi:hypothetical protein
VSFLRFPLPFSFWNERWEFPRLPLTHSHRWMMGGVSKRWTSGLPWINHGNDHVWAWVGMCVFLAAVEISRPERIVGLHTRSVYWCCGGNSLRIPPFSTTHAKFPTPLHRAHGSRAAAATTITNGCSRDWLSCILIFHGATIPKVYISTK